MTGFRAKLSIAAAVGAALLFAGCGNRPAAAAPLEIADGVGNSHAAKATDVSARRRHRHVRRYRVYRPYYGYYRPYYGYYRPRPYYYGPGFYGPSYYGPSYYGPGYYRPGISFGFGFGPGFW
ncbi:MAG TPA: hypothetical protein VIQ05_03110 [Tardiphaga sp.]